MPKKVLEGSRAVAEAVKLCHPDVISAYPITPQTHIVEDLAKMVADGELNSKYLEVESEFSAISSLAGASATGVRTFTATASQGLALMHEVLFAVSGMRLPIVMVVANRALSAPINIWNDWQDSISERDAGWIQLYVETNQEAVDTIIQAYKISEDQKVLLPVMVCMDGFYLTHTNEPVDIPDKKDVVAFLPGYKPKHAYLDPKRPITQGPFTYPEIYYKLRKNLSDTVDASKGVIKKVNDEFEKGFKRGYGNGLIEGYKNNRSNVIISMGSVLGNVREVVDSRNDVGMVKIKCFRPFPREELQKALKSKKTVIVIEKNISLGLGSGALFSEVRDTIYSLKERPKIIGYIGGLGGVDLTTEKINTTVEKSKTKKDGEVEWL